MGYWIFQNEESKRCMAINDDCLADVAIGDELGELLFDGPMPAIIAKMYVVNHGGRLVEAADQAWDIGLDSAMPASSEDHIPGGLPT
ncbi:hypothetical protein ATO7_06195 [Oceanococcus atlanticus]|uniref:Uncharacterized protein n=1 Tax=Oceanococcus atlanticus TaxID=1317117 RepID=A0A1Y1SIP3_9GAMM|nr:hypothetical protein [Oceanococcus atlanticus]ORE89448.1 hypothetical protein ATO7_06195 [Oceanococcus atlanticus]